jgi:hypothetical protein
MESIREGPLGQAPLGQVIVDDPEGRVMALPSGFLYVVDQKRGCHPDRSQKMNPDNLDLIKLQKTIKEVFYEKNTVSRRCSGLHGSSDTMCFGSSKVAGI